MFSASAGSRWVAPAHPGKSPGKLDKRRQAIMNGSSIWDQVLSRIETKVNRHIFYTWFKPTTFVADDGVLLRVRVPNGLFRDWLTKHYAGVSWTRRSARSIARARQSLSSRKTSRRFADGGHRAASSRSFRRRPFRDHRTADRRPAMRPRAAWLPATPSTPSSSDRRTSSRMRRAGPSPKRRRGPTTRCSSTAAWDSARRT